MAGAAAWYGRAALGRASGEVVPPARFLSGGGMGRGYLYHAGRAVTIESHAHPLEAGRGPPRNSYRRIALATRGRRDRLAEVSTSGILLLLGLVFTIVGVVFVPFLCVGVPLLIIGVILVVAENGRGRSAPMSPAFPPYVGMYPSPPPPMAPARDASAPTGGPPLASVGEACRSCGAPLTPAASFCANCGARVLR